MIVCIEHLEVDNLNRLKRSGNLGIYKKWVLDSVNDFDLMCDCLEKINYSSQDLKYEIVELEKISRKNIVYIITLTDWILGAYNRIIKLMRQDVIKDFKYKNESFFSIAEAYFKALRSMVCAHPTKTTNHPQYGFDGSYICADIRNHKKDITFPFTKKEWIRYMDYEGLHDNKCFEPDFYLYVYSMKDTEMKHYSYIGIRYADIYNMANLVIDKICEIDKFLSKAKMSQYVSRRKN